MPPRPSGTATWAGAGTRSPRRPPRRCASSPPTPRSATSRTRPADALADPGGGAWPRWRVRRCSSRAAAPTRSTPPRRWRAATGSSASEPQRTILIRREKAYHGMHTAGTSLAGIPANAAGHGELIEDVIEVPWDDADGAARGDRARRRRPRGGVLLRAGDRRRRRLPAARRATWQAARDVCRDTDVLFVADEVITGFGRMRRLVRLDTGSASSPTSSRAPRASPAATCRWAR